MNKEDKLISMVNAPEDVLIQKAPHYNKGGIECIEAAEAMLTKEELIGAYRFQVLKYIWRLWDKDQALTNAKKAMYYLERIIFLLS